jgi:hypothetical protein
VIILTEPQITILLSKLCNSLSHIISTTQSQSNQIKQHPPQQDNITDCLNRYFIQFFEILGLNQITEYPTDSVGHGYQGLTKNGTLTFESGDKYEGSLENGVMAGFGKLTYSKDDKNNREYYTGEFKNGKRHGSGKLVWKNGQMCEGDWANDTLNGKGKVIYSVHDESMRKYYIGDFKDGKKHGRGRVENTLGAFYEGDFENDQINGTGKSRWEDGNSHEGEYVNGKRNGKGTFYWANGNKYEGEFKNEKLCGIGTFTWPSGIKYFGEFANDAPNGNGTYLYHPASIALIYEGEFKDWNKHGFGKLFGRNGERYEGQFKEGVYSGFGKYYFKDGTRFEGNWVNDKRHGSGTQFDANDNVEYKGHWINGARLIFI